MHDPVSRDRLVATNLERHGVPYSTLLPQVQNTLNDRQESQAERDVREFLQTLTGQSWASDWTAIAPKQLDCYNAERRWAVEFNGLVWHSERMGIGRRKHADKYRACQVQGIRLVTIFEDEWLHRRAQVESVLKSRLGIFDRRIYARHTQADIVRPKHALSHINAWHLQPQTKARYAAVLRHHGNVVGAITFTPHHRSSSNNTSIVLSRLCFAPGVQVVGGASKLISAMVPTLVAAGYTRMISWSDNRWSDGGVYRQLGWTMEEDMEPDYSYVDLKRRGVRLPKQACRKARLKARSGQTELERARELGLSRIWDCGKKRWVCDLPQNPK